MMESPDMARSKKSQTNHDAKVRQIANQLGKQGYDIQADVSGFPKPGTIGGLRPDVIAKKPGERKIIEVETPDSLKDSHAEKQRRAFKDAADRSKKTKFSRRITGKKKK